METLRRLISSGEVKATDTDEEGIPPLHWAAINGQYIASKYLIENGAHVDLPAGHLLATPLQWTTRQGHLSVVQLLLQYDADLNYRDVQGFSTLHHAITCSSSPSTIDYLTGRCTKAQLDIQDLNGFTPLIWALAYKDTLSAEMLLGRGASVNARAPEGLVPMDWALEGGVRSNIRMLLERGADVIPGAHLVR